MLNWDDLRYLLAVARRGTFSGAAEELGVNRTTVARRVGALEHAVGQQLFESDNEGLQISPAGKRLLETAKAVEKEIQASSRAIDADAGSAGPLRIAAPVGLGAEFMPELIRFRHARPQIQLEVITVADPALLLNQRQADIGIVVSDRPPEHLQGPPLGELERAAYASADYLESYPADLPLGRHRWVGWGRAMSRSLVARWMQSNLPPDIEIAARVNSWTAMKEAVAGGLGISYLWCFLADEEPRLQRIRPPDKELSTGLWLLTPEDIPPNSRVQACLEELPPLLAQRINWPATTGEQ